jgi:hypothetical protein
MASKTYIYLVAAAVCFLVGGVLGWRLRGGGDTPAPTITVNESEQETTTERVVTTERRPDGTTVVREENRNIVSNKNKRSRMVVPKEKRKTAIEAGPRWNYQDLIRGNAKPEVWEAGVYRRVGDGNWWVGVRAASDRTISVSVRVEI